MTKRKLVSTMALPACPHGHRPPCDQPSPQSMISHIMQQQLAGSKAALVPASLRQAPFTAAQRNAVRAPVVRVQCSSLMQRAGKAAAAVALSLALTTGGTSARLEGVNKPELLPTGTFTPIIDVAGFLTEGEEARIRSRVEALEADTGVKLRVLAQNYPQTPGLAIKDYWSVDADTVVFVADPNTGNVLNFNVGGNVDFKVPRSFWSRLAGRYGTKFYWQEQGQDVAIVNAVAAIDSCVREPMGRGQCSAIKGEIQ